MVPWRCDVAEKRVKLICVAVVVTLLGWVGWHIAQLGHELVGLIAAESASGHPVIRFFER